MAFTVYDCKIIFNEVLPRSPWIGEPHHDTVDQGAPLAEVGGEAVLGGRVVEAAEKEFAGLLGLIHFSQNI